MLAIGGDGSTTANLARPMLMPQLSSLAGRSHVLPNDCVS